MAIIHRIGEPENESETKAIRVLADELPDDCFIIHNFELSAGHGALPYEYDVVVVGKHAVYHVEVKGYRGLIRGDRHQWRFENGWVYPSPIPLANKKTKILASRLKAHGKFLDRVFCETVILLTDDGARARLNDEQAGRVIRLDEAAAHLTNPGKLPVRTDPIDMHHDAICEVILGSRPSKKVREIGLYDVLEKIGQHHNRTVYLAEHKYIHTRPKTVLKVFHFDVYADKARKERQIRAIFHDQEALRLLSSHPNIVRTGDFFAHGGDMFVLPHEYYEDGKPLEVLLDQHKDTQIPWAEKRKIIEGVARGLRHAHASGVIHRDVKPLSVVFAPGDVVKLVNFDVALIKGAPEDAVLSDIKERLDPRYTAPEVWKDPACANEASDVYSLGVTFYRLLTNHQPYPHVNYVLKQGKAPLDLDRLMRELSTPGSEDFMGHPKDVVDTIVRMCALDPKERYSSMDGVIEDLELIGDE